MATAKGVPSDEPVRGKTISDKDWEDLNRRLNENGGHVAKGSKSHTDDVIKHRQMYENRHRN
jgi:hypothetical protein